jgi:hypothetical protein
MRTFWYYLTIASVIWYSVVTLYVAFKGTFDIREMLGNLKNRKH